MDKALKLENLSISVIPSYLPRAGEYKGSMKYTGEHGNIELQLDEKLSQEILKLVADSLTRATKELAKNLTASVFENVTALEDKS